MNEERERVWLGYFAAVLAGVGIGLLFAPRPGRETRGRIGRWLDERELQPGIMGRLARLRHPRITSAHHNGKSLKTW